MSSPLLIERSRGVVVVRGRDPLRMVQGLATADIQATVPGRGAYTAFLTAKGRMVADARVFRRGSEKAPELLLDVDPGALEPLVDHIRRFVPPLFARAEDVSADWAVVGVYGTGASDVASALAPGTLADAPEESVVALEGAGAVMAQGGASGASDASAGPGETGRPGETGASGGPGETGGTGETGEVADPGALADPGAFAARTGLTGDDGWDLFVPAAWRERVVEALLMAGARPGSPETLEALRVAAGRPRWGRELTEEVIPLEAGLLDRAISQSKGCYTGQEVIVRILHRGHVNRHLRRLVFEAGAAEAGAALYEPGSDRPRGVVTSAVANDAGALGLGYVRREVEPPAELRVGAPDGPAVRVEVLEP